MTRLITLPLITANLAAGALLAFAFAMLEVSDSIVLAQREAHYPVTKAIAALSERLGDGPSVAAAMGAWGMLLLAWPSSWPLGSWEADLVPSSGPNGAALGRLAPTIWAACHSP